VHTLERNDAETLKHLVKQGGFLLKLHLAEFAKDPTSRATESSRSNLMAVRHTVKQLYGSAVAIDVGDLVKLTAPSMTESHYQGLCDKRVYSGRGADTRAIARWSHSYGACQNVGWL
jgi:hypothetical protein